MNPINPQLLNDFVVFGQELIRSQDVDPLYPVLQWLEKDMDTEQALWFTFLYMTFYNVASAAQARQWVENPQQTDIRLAKLPTATERRNLRAGKTLQHMGHYATLVQLAGSQREFLQKNWSDDTIANYEAFWVTAQRVYQNGRWAAFKWAEILKKVHGWNLAAPDMRMEFCSGPKAGLCLMYELDQSALDKAGESGIWAYNFYGKDLRYQCAQRGLVAPDWETLETVLCNFHSLRDGRYYIGHDIDELQEVIDKSGLDPESKQWLYAARAKVLPGEYLGELNGWHGVDKSANRIYRDTGIVHARGVNLNV